MTEIIMVSPLVGASKYNKAEYAFFAKGVISRVKAAGVETIHAPAAKFAEFELKYEKLEDLVGISRVSEETAKMAETSAEMVSLVKHILGVVDTAKEVPIPTMKQAATSLSNLVHPYEKVCRLPQQQKEQTIQGLLTDLSKTEAVELVETLQLQTVVETLTLKHAQYVVLQESRANTQMKNSEENATKLRQEMYVLYNDIVNTIWAYSITEPSEEATGFIKSLNKLIADVETAYNRRKAQSGSTKEETEVEELPATDVTEGASPEDDSNGG